MDLRTNDTYKKGILYFRSHQTLMKLALTQRF
jgi:hypothetical protein